MSENPYESAAETPPVENLCRCKRPSSVEDLLITFAVGFGAVLLFVAIGYLLKMVGIELVFLKDGRRI